MNGTPISTFGGNVTIAEIMKKHDDYAEDWKQQHKRYVEQGGNGRYVKAYALVHVIEVSFSNVEVTIRKAPNSTRVVFTIEQPSLLSEEWFNVWACRWLVASLVADLKLVDVIESHQLEVCIELY